MLFNSLEARVLFTSVSPVASQEILIRPFATIDHGVLRIDGTTSDDQLSVTVVDGVAKVVFKNAYLIETFAETAPQDYRQTLKSRRGHVFQSVVVNLSGGDDIASVKSDIPVTLNGEAGDDALTLNATSSHLAGGDGDDTLISSPTLLTGEPEQMVGREIFPGQVPAKPVEMIAFSGNCIEGNAGDDRIETRGGDDEVHGGSGSDTLVLLNSNVEVNRGRAGGIGYVPEAHLVLRSRVSTFSVDAIETERRTRPILVKYNQGMSALRLSLAD